MAVPGNRIGLSVEANYAHLWEFHVRPGMEADFETHYGSSGTWAQLFRQSPDYIGTLLLKDNSIPGRYVTLDRWRSEEAYSAFRSAIGEQYAQLDKECERLTRSESSLGAWNELLPRNSFEPKPLHSGKGSAG